MAEKLPVIIDNRGENKVLNALKRLLPNLQRMDVATGVFEVGSFLLLEGLWQDLERIRILMGDETARRTKREIVQAMLQTSNDSIEREKEHDDALTGLPAVRNAIAKKSIMLRTYSKSKFHAKSYLMESKEASPVDFAIVGSSNFTRPGLTENLELNLFSTDQAHIEGLRNWYNELWKEGEDVSPEVLKVIEPHLKEYDSFIVYAKALYEFFAGREKTQDEWELSESVLYPKLSQYQRDGYHRALQIVEQWNGALICDGVGLGKTYIGLMLLERCIHNNERVLLIVPKSAEESVWMSNGRTPNLDPKFVEQFAKNIGLEFITDGKGDPEKTFGPEEIFNYIYAVFHSPAYRSWYAEFLKRDFPQVPITSNIEIFRTLCNHGGELVSLHLMESDKLNDHITTFPVSGDNTVTKVGERKKQLAEVKNGKGRLFINKTQYFGGLPEEVWNFHIGGYQVCYKWLYDRKKAGRKLSAEDIEHYHKIVVAINETIKIMKQIDETIDTHNGWPIQ